MKLKTILTGAGVCLTLALAFGQTATEAQRISISTPLGTGRNLGTGNSMFAIGPDFSAIGSNPSGIGGFWKSEFVISGGLSFQRNDAALVADRNNTIVEPFSYMTMPNIGLVIANRPLNSNWKTSNWAIGINRVAEYRNQIRYAGRTVGSITDAWRENATGTVPANLNGFEEGLAYEAGAIYDFEGDNIYESDYRLNPQYALHKEERTTINGGKSEIFLGYGANYDDKLLFGFTVNLPIVNLTESRTYWEVDGTDNGIPFFNNLRLDRYTNTTGYGLNGKLGITIKPVRQLHLAAAIHTPTKFFLTDNYNTTLSYDYTDANNNGPIRAESPYGSFEYALRTPWSLMGGIGIIAGKSGFISASLKWTDYGSMKYDYSVRGNGNGFEQIERKVNQDIRIQYGSAVDLNLGGEFVLEALRLRGGVSLAQSPFSNDDSLDPAYHAGIGYRGEHYFVDLGYKLAKTDIGYLPYETIDAPAPLVVTDQTRHFLALTLGLKF